MASLMLRHWPSVTISSSEVRREETSPPYTYLEVGERETGTHEVS